MTQKSTLPRTWPWTLLSVLALSAAIGCGPPPPEEDMGDVRLRPGEVDPDAPEEFTETESGLKYRIRRRGSGAKPDANDQVRVHYRGWLDSGDVFDSSYGQRSRSFEVGQVVPGFAEGLQLVREGGMIELEIPPELGYGAIGKAPDVPPNATLHFLVEMESVLSFVNEDPLITP